MLYLKVVGVKKVSVVNFPNPNQGYILMIGYGIGIYILKLHSTTFSNFESEALREGKSNGNTNISQSLQSVALL